MNGAGNDFIFINNFEEKLNLDILPDLARKLCDRKTGIKNNEANDGGLAGADGSSRIGADGMMVIDQADGDADFKMRFYNSDGSIGEMCGNGARCTCRYGYEHGFSGETQTIETVAGIVTGERIDESLYKIKLNNPSRFDLDYPIEIDGVRYECSYVELGNPGIPHAVIPYKNLKDEDEDRLRELGRKIRYSEAFYKGVNVNFYEVIGNGEKSCKSGTGSGRPYIYERTYERGVEDMTLACGTGTASTVLVLTEKGIVDGRNVHVNMRGGELIIDWNKKDLYLTGPTEIEYVKISDFTHQQLDCIRSRHVLT